MPEATLPGPAVNIRVLCAGAPKAGVSICAEAFTQRARHRVDLAFATAPAIRERVMGGGTEADMVIAPVPDMGRFEAAGRIVSEIGVVIGSVEAGVAVRASVRDPDISSADAFRNAVLEAGSLVYNQASSGLYIAELMGRLGIANEVAAKTTRLPTGAAVMEHLAASGVANEIGFGQIPEIRRFSGRGVRLVGPLPREIGKATTYSAGLLTGAAAPEAATAFLRFLGSPTAKRALSAAGVA